LKIILVFASLPCYQKHTYFVFLGPSFLLNCINISRDVFSVRLHTTRNALALHTLLDVKDSMSIFAEFRHKPFWSLTLEKSEIHGIIHTVLHCQ